MEIDLKGKVGIVTGAGRGIGREIARTFAREGVHTIVTDVVPAYLENVEKEWQSNGWAGQTCLCDVTDKAQIEGVIGKLDRVDILVNNAGVLRAGAVETLKEEDWDLSLDVNLKGVFLMCQAVIPVMKRQKSGRIINAASFAAIIPALNTVSYAAAKAGVVYLTRVLAGELGPWNITVNCYAPGMIPTEMNHFADAPEARQEQLLDTLTLRQWGDPQDVANLICFLASDLAGYITGALLDVSGGKLTTQMPQMAYSL